MKQIVVIGGGASGMMAAIAAARQGASVTITEGADRPGRKLLMTGNGRCNLTNLLQDEACYHGADPVFIKEVLAQFPVDKTLDFFHELGLLTCDRAGYVYPSSGQASSVLDVLLLELARLSVKLKCREKVTAVEKKDGRFAVKTGAWSYGADAVILAAGSCAAPATGSDGSGYRLAALCGHTAAAPLPSLVPLKTAEPWVKKLSGLRTASSVSLSVRLPDGTAHRYTQRGEVQWTDYGVSGIAVFQLSRHAVSCLNAGGSARLAVDLLPDIAQEELNDMLNMRKTRVKTCADMLAGILARKAAPVLLGLAGLSSDTAAPALDGAQILALSQLLKNLPLTVTGSRSFEQAQACQGGIRTAEVDAGTLASRRMPGLYFAGEILDVDGACGGYNLQWAWSSGFVAGYHAARCAASLEKTI